MDAADPVARLRQDQDLLRLRLTRRVAWAMLLVACVLLTLRLDRGVAVLATGAGFVILLACGIWLLPRRPTWVTAYNVVLVLAFNVLALLWATSWDRGGMPPALGLGISSCLLLTYVAGMRAGVAALVLFLVRVSFIALWSPEVTNHHWDLVFNTVVAALSLQVAAWMHTRIHRRTADQLAQQTLALRKEGVTRAALVAALLEKMEAPLRAGVDASPAAAALRVSLLQEGLTSAQAARKAMDPLHDAPQDLATPRKLFVPLLGLGVLAAVAVSLQALVTHAPNAWLAPAASVVLVALLVTVWRRPEAWKTVAALTLLVVWVAVAVDTLQSPAGVFPAGLALGVVVIAFAALWLGARTAFLVTGALVATNVVGVFLGGVGLGPSDTAMAWNLIADWALLALLVAPASTLQHQLIERLEAQRRELGASLRVRRRLLGTLFHDAANHVTALATLCELQAEGLTNAEDDARVERVCDRLARLLASARHWLFVDTSFSPGQLTTVAVEALGRDMRDLFGERLEGKSLVLATDLPAGMTVQCVPELLSDGVIGNLLSNAVKFSPPGATIELAARRDGTGVSLMVSDRGPGLPPGLLDGLLHGLDLPSRPGSRGEQGQGLGLSLASEHVGRMGGRLAFAARPGGGTLATVWLPSTDPR